MAARALRELGHAGELVLIGDEPHAPYERPPLSKAVLADEGMPDIGLLPEPFQAQSGLALKRGRRVVRLDPARRELHLDDGGVQPYRACLLATGGGVRVLPALPPAPRASITCAHLTTHEACARPCAPRAACW